MHYALALAVLTALSSQPQKPLRPMDNPAAAARHMARVRGESGPAKPLFEQGREQTHDKNYEGSLVCLLGTKPTAEQYNEYCFLMAVNYFSLNNKVEAEKWVKRYNDSFEPNKHRRHEALMWLMENDLAN